VGQCKQIHGDEDASVHGVTKPRFVDVKETILQELLKTEPVKIVLFDSCRPGINYPVWTCPDSSYMVCFHSMSNHPVAPKCWLLEGHALSHNKLGGVTNGGFCCRVEQRCAAPILEWPSDPLAVLSYLHQVIDPTLGGSLAKLNVRRGGSGLLEWKQQFGKVLVPTVDSKHKWEWQKLH
jgi:hypothetical protein